MDEAALAELAADIGANGLREPIWTHEGKVIDGRNRFKACALAKVKPKFRKWDGKGSLVAFAWSLNGTRRHMTPSQKAAVAVEALPLLEAEAKERQEQQAERGKEGGRGNKKAGETLPAILPEGFLPPKGESREKAAIITGSSPRYVSEAKKLKQERPSLFAKVKSGALTLQRVGT